MASTISVKALASSVGVRRAATAASWVRASSLSFTISPSRSPRLDSRARCNAPTAAVSAMKPSCTAVAIKPTFVSRLMVWLRSAASSAESRSFMLPSSDLTAFRIRSRASSVLAMPLLSASSTRASFASRPDVSLVIAVSMAASFLSRFPPSDSTAFRISSCCFCCPANPSCTAVSMRASLPDRSAVWLSTTASTAASFSSSVSPSVPSASTIRACAVP